MCPVIYFLAKQGSSFTTSRGAAPVSSESLTRKVPPAAAPGVAGPGGGAEGDRGLRGIRLTAHPVKPPDPCSLLKPHLSSLQR